MPGPCLAGYHQTYPPSPSTLMTHSSNLSTGLTQKLRHTYSLASVLKQVLRLFLHHCQHPVSSGAEGVLTNSLSQYQATGSGERERPCLRGQKTWKPLERADESPVPQLEDSPPPRDGPPSPLLPTSISPCGHRDDAHSPCFRLSCGNGVNNSGCGPFFSSALTTRAARVLIVNNNNLVPT